MTAEDQEAFWALVIPEPNSGCWLWAGRGDGRGYGSFCCNGISKRAHRWAWEFEHGPIPVGAVVRHVACDNPPCVNPRHLAIGTQAENVADMLRQGRQARKLSAEQVEELVSCYADGVVTQQELAETYGVTLGAINHILQGRSWQHVGGVPARRRYQEFGSRHHNAKLLEEEVRAIREAYARGDISQSALAAQYGVSRRAIGNIVTGRLWRHVQEARS